MKQNKQQSWEEEFDKKFKFDFGYWLRGRGVSPEDVKDFIYRVEQKAEMQGRQELEGLIGGLKTLNLVIYNENGEKVDSLLNILTELRNNEQQTE